jgi:hypothetical protein
MPAQISKQFARFPETSHKLQSPRRREIAESSTGGVVLRWAGGEARRTEYPRPAAHERVNVCVVLTTATPGPPVPAEKTCCVHDAH